MVPLLLVPLLFGAISHAGENSQDLNYKLEVQSKAPDSAPVVPANFFGFGFETAFFPKFGWNHDSKNFSENIVKSVGDRMSAPILLRIGGTSGDLVQYKPDQKDQPAVCISGPDCPHSSLDTFALGPGYFDVFSQFKNAHMVIQAPITPKIHEENWLKRSMDYVREASNRLKDGNRLAAIALGNEPNWYEYNLETYASRALQVQKAAIETLKLEGDAKRIFQLGEIPNEMISSKRSHKYGLTAVLKSKLNNEFTKFAAQHYYQVQVQKGETEPTLQSSLMNHKAITARFPPIDKTIEHIKQNGNKVDYVISETGSAIGNADVSFSGSFGAALWAVDFHLYAMTRGVKRVSNTMRPEATHAYWIPVDPYAPPFAEKNPKNQKTTGPAVQGMFPSAPFIADFVGTQGKVVEISVPGSPEHFSAYALYDEKTGSVKRVALVNLVVWSPSIGKERGNAHITLTSGQGFKAATVRRMHSDNGAAGKGFDLGDSPHDNVTWAGEQWTYKVDQGQGHFPHGKEDEDATIKDGKVTVKVPDSEAIIVSFS